MVLVSVLLVGVFVLLPLFFSLSGGFVGSAAPVERGFSCLREDISYFNNHFFIILVIFVLFDLEVVLSLCILCGRRGFVLGLLFFMGITLLLEWKLGKVQWGYCPYSK